MCDLIGKAMNYKVLRLKRRRFCFEGNLTGNMFFLLYCMIFTGYLIKLIACYHPWVRSGWRQSLVHIGTECLTGLQLIRNNQPYTFWVWLLHDYLFVLRTSQGIGSKFASWFVSFWHVLSAFLPYLSGTLISADFDLAHGLIFRFAWESRLSNIPGVFAAVHSANCLYVRFLFWTTFCLAYSLIILSSLQIW